MSPQNTLTSTTAEKKKSEKRRETDWFKVTLQSTAAALKPTKGRVKSYGADEKHGCDDDEEVTKRGSGGERGQ